MTTSRPVFIWPSTSTVMPRPEVVADERLLRLGQAELPGNTGRLDRAQRRRPGAALVAGDGDVVGPRLRHPGGHRPHADLGHELDRHRCPRVGAAQVVDQLLEILDRVDVVVRRRRDQLHARRRVAQLGDVVADLVARQLAALTGLGALRHLDLEPVGVGQIGRGDAEAGRRHLPDGRVALVAVGVGDQPAGILPALAGVRPAADPVHGDRQRLVRFGGDRPQAHGAGGEALDDLGGRLDLCRAGSARAPPGTAAAPAGWPADRCPRWRGGRTRRRRP